MENIYHQARIQGELTGDVNLDVSSIITTVAIRYNYEEHHFPLFVIELNVNYSEYNTIRQNNVDIMLNIDYYNLLDNDLNEVDDSTDPIIEGNIVNTTLKIYDKNLPELNYMSSDDEDDFDNISDGGRFTISLNCIPRDLIEKNDSVINTVYSNASIDEVLVDMISDFDNDIYIEPSINSDREETMLIPPMNLCNAIRFLDDEYGIYESELRMFFDTDESFILPSNPSELTYSPNRVEITVRIQEDVSDNSVYNYTYMEDDVVTRVFPSLGIVSIDDITKNALGGTSFVSSYDSDFDIVTRKYELNDESKIRYFWNKGERDLWEKKALSIRTKRTDFNMDNINPKLFKPNTTFIINTTEFGSEEYSLVGKAVYFSTNDLKNYIIRTSLDLTK